MNEILTWIGIVGLILYVIRNGVIDARKRREAEIRASIEPKPQLLAAAWRAGYNRAKFESAHYEQARAIESLIKNGASIKNVTDYVDRQSASNPRLGPYAESARNALLQYAADLKMLLNIVSWREAEPEGWKGDIAT